MFVHYCAIDCYFNTMISYNKYTILKDLVEAKKYICKLKGFNDLTVQKMNENTLSRLEY